MTVDDFKSLCQSLDIDDSSPFDYSMRLGATIVSSGPTRATTGAPFVSSQPVHDLELHETIGEGGMGLVRSATQHALRREVAVKTLKPDIEVGEASQTLMHEALVTGRLEHPNVVPIYTLGETEFGAPIIVMKRITGVSWHQCILDPTAAPDFRADDPLGWHLDIFEEVCLAAHFAHSREIIHRDIKPENVMVGAFGEVYLLDWGVAVTVDADKSGPLVHVTQATGICGTPMYMAPEMAAGESDRIGIRSDVYLLGATLYHALTGSPPHQGRSAYQILMSAYVSEPAKFPADVPDALVKICHKAMARDPNDRYESADELRRAVIDFRTHRTSITLTTEASERLVVLEDELDGRCDDAEIRNLFGECHFGFEQGLRVWRENPDAHRGLQRALERMARYELSLKNVAAAEALISKIDGEDEDLRGIVQSLRAELEERRRELRKLELLGRESNVAIGARYRMWGAVAAVSLLTVMPFIGKYNYHNHAGEPGLQGFFHDGLAVCAILMTLLFLFRRGTWANQANRRMSMLVAAFALSIPIFRYVAMNSGMTIPQVLSAESAAYAVAYAGLALLSEFNPTFGFVVYVVAAVIGVHNPEWIFEITSLSNFLAVGYLVVVWRAQDLRQRGEDERAEALRDDGGLDTGA